MNRKIKRRPKRRIDVKGSKTQEAADDVMRIIKRKKSTCEFESVVEFLSSGSTTLNLALSGQGPMGGWARGRILNIVGDGSSGKTLLALELAFWCFKNIFSRKSKLYGKVKKLYLVYNNVEGVMDFPLVKMYGQEFVDAVEWISTKNIEKMGRDFAGRLINLERGEFLLYVVDSWDALGSRAGDERFEKSIKEDKEMDGSYNLEKQKFASNVFFSNICGRMENNSKDATLVIISQVRTKIGATWGKKTYRAGGKALDFYTHQVAWIREIEKLKKTKKKQTRIYGIRSEVKVERSKVAKPFRESAFTILYDYGLDDISSIIDFMWGKGVIRFQGETFKTRKRFIKHIEDNNFESLLALEAEKKWQEIEQSFEDEVKARKKRY